MKRVTNAGAALAVILALASPPQAPAQAVANAQMHGLITDASGAAVAAAQVRATQTETGQVRTTASGADGSYVLLNLAVGPYKLEVGSPSFSSYVQSGIILQVGTNVQINVALQVGAVTQEVQVASKNVELEVPMVVVRCSVVVEAPAGATLKVNGTPVPNPAPVELSLLPGLYRISAENAGSVRERMVNVKPEARLRVELKP